MSARGKAAGEPVEGVGRSSEGRDPVAVCFGENLRFWRRRANLTQVSLAHRASLHRTEIGLLERAKRLPRIDTLLKLANALSVRPDQLLDGCRTGRMSESQSGGR